MRSSRPKPTKSVSICSEPVTENGPCKKKEAMETNGIQDCNGHDKAEAHALASQVVQDVVRLASETALERVTTSSEVVTPCQSPPLDTGIYPTNSTCDREDRSLQRLPTIQIETIPSMPSSPEWPSPPPEATIPEETKEEVEEALNAEQIEIGFQEDETDTQDEVKRFAATFLEDLFEKALQTAEERQKAQDMEIARETATQAVEEIISKASESAAELSTAGLTFPCQEEQECNENLPTIHIDTVASLPTSPLSEDEKDNAVTKNSEKQEKAPEAKQDIPEITYMQYDDEKKDDSKEEEKGPPKIKFSEAPNDLQDFTSSYIKDILAKAVTTAEEKTVRTATYTFEDVELMKTSGPWYIRAREAFIRVLRSACFCAPRRNSS